MLIYIKEVRKALSEMNYCENQTFPFPDSPPESCAIEHMCEECQNRLCDLLEWSMMDDEGEAEKAAIAEQVTS